VQDAQFQGSPQRSEVAYATPSSVRAPRIPECLSQHTWA